MSIEKHQKSTCFRAPSSSVKVNYNSKLLPIDFFPKINSQSPRKKADYPPSRDLLAEWYERDDSQDKPQKQFRRITHIKPIKTNTSRVSLCQVQQPSPSEKQRYVLNYYNRIKQHLKTNSNPKKIEDYQQNTKCLVPRVFIRRNQSISIREKQLRKVRMIKSQSRSKRSQTPQSKDKLIPIERRSLRQLPRRFESGQVAVGFDGMVTFSRFK